MILFNPFKNERKNLTDYKKYKERQKKNQERIETEQAENEISVFGRLLTPTERREYARLKQAKQKARQESIHKVKNAVKRYSGAKNPLALNTDLSLFDATKTTSKRKRSYISI